TQTLAFMKILCSALVILTGMSCNSKITVDLVVHHGKVYTVDSSFSMAEAFAVKEGKIIMTGTNDQVLQTYTSSNIVDAGGKSIYPGFIDGHAHFYGYALSLGQVNLVGTESWEECITRITEFAQENKIPAGKWISGQGWDQNDWSDAVFPSKEMLDKAFPENPVFLSRIDGHAAIANTLALALANVKAGDTVQGGMVETKGNVLTGVLIDNAVGKVSRIIPLPDSETMEKWVKTAEMNCLGMGLTTITDCGLSRAEVEFLDALQKNGKLKMKLTVLLSDVATNYDHYLVKGIYKSDRMHISGFKLFADGALGSRGACLLQPYQDKPNWNGFLLDNIGHYKHAFERIFDSPFQACIHAIGDSANRMALQQFGEILKGENDRRWRIEHAQVVNMGDMKLFGRYNIIPSVQPTHATSDMYWATERLGSERIKGAYAYQSLLEQSGWIVLGTDFPVEDINQFKTFYAAVVRKDASGYPPQGFEAQEALTKEQALRGMTIWAAKGNFEEKEKGSIEKGKWADFIITDTDIMECNPSAILQTKVLSTYVNGEKVSE
ncbi:MAG TPA: amidohydrolase, partial [Agriterribacter sp.]|nr:amidohydrolase [Agriterribacter sp.]